MYFRVFLLFSLFAYATSKSELSCKVKKAFVDGHNSRRLRLAKGDVPNQPAASEMKYMIWDDELAAKATKWASRNVFEHNPDRTIGSKRFDTGENIYWVASTDHTFKFDPENAMDAWFDEYRDYKYGPLSASQFGQGQKMIGHYTQMAWSNSIYLGCGVSKVIKDNMLNYYVVCNYGPPGNFLGETPYPAKGKPSGKLVCGTTNCNKLYGDKC